MPCGEVMAPPPCPLMHTHTRCHSPSQVSNLRAGTPVISIMRPVAVMEGRLLFCLTYLGPSLAQGMERKACRDDERLACVRGGRRMSVPQKWDPFTQTGFPRDPDFGYAYCTPPDHHRPAGQ